MRTASSDESVSKRPVPKIKPKPAKVEKVMGEFKAGSLKSSSGEQVTNPKQAVAIAMSEGRRAGRK